MKVLFLTNLPAPYRLDFFECLGAKCELTVFIERAFAADRDKSWHGSKAENFKIEMLKGINIGAEGTFCPSVGRKLSGFDIIVIGGYSTPTGMAAIRSLSGKKTPFILNCDGGVQKQDDGIKGRIKTYFISRASAYLSTGTITDAYLRRYGAGDKTIYRYPFSSVKAENMLKTPLSDDEKREIKRRLLYFDGPLALGSGRFIDLKNYSLLLKAWRYVDSSCGLALIGGGPLKAEYERLISEYGLKNVFLFDNIAPDKVDIFYRAADVLVHPSKTDIWGLVVGEAMARALPVISTDRCVAAAELVKNGQNGYLVEPENERELAEKINTVLCKDNLRRDMSAEALRTATPYTIENMAARHMEIFEDFLKRRGARCDE